MNFSPNGPTPEETITSNVNATLSILRSAARFAAPSPDTPGVKRFIYTSSSGAAAMPRPGEPYTVDATSYNHQAVAIALSGKGPKGMAGGYITYSAAKTRAELELWKWYEEEKPGFVLNSSMFIDIFLFLFVSNSPRSPLHISLSSSFCVQVSSSFISPGLT